MKTSRQRLLEYIIARRIITIGELSRVLKMSEANVRHHLNEYLQLGLICEVSILKTGAKGRPARLFRPSDQLLGHNLAGLSDQLLSELRDEFSEEELHKILFGAAQRMKSEIMTGTGSLVKQTGISKSFTNKLVAVIYLLNQHSYQARWEAHTDAARLILGHCPFAAIIQKHPELCDLDQILIQELVEKPIEQTAKLVLDHDGIPHCIFRVL